MPDMTDFKPYAIKASYDWIIDNAMTPQLIVSTAFAGLDLPEIHRGKPGDMSHKILLNIGPTATSGLQIDIQKKLISFHARFSGVAHYAKIPMDAVEAIHAQESGEGTVFKIDYSKIHLTGDDKPARPALKLVK